MDNRTPIHLTSGSPTDSGFFEGGRWAVLLEPTVVAREPLGRVVVRADSSVDAPEDTAPTVTRDGTLRTPSPAIGTLGCLQSHRILHRRLGFCGRPTTPPGRSDRRADCHLVAVIGFALAPGPRRISDRFIIFFAIGFGWVMSLGWIPGLETCIDVPGVLLALTAGVVAANQFRNGRFRWSLRQWPLLTEFAAVAIGIAATLSFAVPIVRMNVSGRPTRSSLDGTMPPSSTCSNRFWCTEDSLDSTTRARARSAADLGDAGAGLEPASSGGCPMGAECLLRSSLLTLGAM